MSKINTLICQECRWKETITDFDIWGLLTTDERYRDYKLEDAVALMVVDQVLSDVGKK